MHVFRGLPSPLQRRPSAVAIGNFDGVHLGHQALLEYVKEAAQARGLVPSVVTFEPHPKDFFGRGGEVARISTLYDKVNAILGTGIERIYILPFNSRLACMPAETFVRDVLLKGLDACWMSVGKDFRFGGDRAGSVELLEELSRTLPYELYVSPTFYHKEARVSSSRIREALAVGDLYEAALMLGRPYSMTGRVIHGAALGRTRPADGVRLIAPDFPIFGCWHMPKTDAPYVCLEPWSSLPSRSGVIEDLKTQPDLICLPAGEVYRTQWSLTCF